MESLPRRAEGSGALARVLTILLALVLLPLSTVALAFGTSRLGQHLMTYNAPPWELPLTAETVTALLAIGVGLLLLALLALSGIASSAGLLAMAALSHPRVKRSAQPSPSVEARSTSVGRKATCRRGASGSAISSSSSASAVRPMSSEGWETEVSGTTVERAKAMSS